MWGPALRRARKYPRHSTRSRRAAPAGWSLPAGRVNAMMEKIPITAAGYARMQEELKELKSVERPAVIKAIEAARDPGDLSENAEYHAAREHQRFIQDRKSVG